ncbi:MAG: EAL domain-containing protein [Gammaproteobacteria bacterium]|nr:EAL domain-containing protein [Gammaproteobacteria bacterium]
MVERNFLPILVISQSQNNAEKLNGILRGAGHAVRSSWASSLEDAEEIIQDQKPDLIFAFLRVEKAPIHEVISSQQKLSPDSAVLAVASKLDEDAMAVVIERGAHALLTLDNERLLLAVIKRELAAVQSRRDLREAQALVGEYQSRFQEFLAESGDSIAYAQDGILIQANPSFAEMFGFTDPDDVEGYTIMDLFAKGDQDALREALVATNKGKEVGTLSVQGMKNGETFDTKLEFDQTELDGEPCIEIAIRGEGDTSELRAEMQAEMDEIGKRDPLTGLFHRHHFVELVNQTIKNKPAGASALMFLKPDHFSQIEEKVGPLASDNVLKLLAAHLRESVEEQDLLARFGGNIFTAVITRKNDAELDAFAEKLQADVAGRVFEAGGQSTSMTVSIGYADYKNEFKNAGQLISLAQLANKEARDKGGNKAVRYAPAEVDKEGKVLDAGWVKRITGALKDNRFQLVFQPIASLEGDVSEMFDILVRMKTEDGEEVMPGDFIPAAERNNLMTGIDRWILQNSMSRLVERHTEGKKAQFFIRISEQSLADSKFVSWLDGVLGKYKPQKGSVVFQIAESTAEKRLNESKAVAETAKKFGQLVALEHFGIGHNSMQMFQHIPMAFVKIDGSFMQVIGSDDEKREKVQAILEKSREMSIESVAERVENANTMAVLWQLGVNYIQGNYVQEPEVVMAEDAKLPA